MFRFLRYVNSPKLIRENSYPSCWNIHLGYKNITYIDSKNLSGYVGLGIGSIIQLQTGFSKDGISLRFRSDIQLGYIFWQMDSWNNLNEFWSGFLGQITVSPSIEKYFKNSQMNWYFGIGLGFSLNNVYGIFF